MTIYIVIFVVCLMFAVMELAAPKSSPRYTGAHRYFFLSFVLLLFFVAGFRECGFDFYNYNVYFEELNSPDWFSRGFEIGSEPGYSFVNYALGNYPAVIVVITAAILFVQFEFIYTFSALPFLALIFYLGLFMYPSTMGQYRQALAIGVVLWAIVNREHKLKFFLLIALAMMFHLSAILGILALFIPHRLRSLRFYLILFVGAIVCSLVAQTIYTNFISSLPQYVATKLAHYAATENSPLGINSAVLLRAFVFFTCFYFRDKSSTTPYNSLFLNIYFLSLLIYTALGFAPQVAGRGSIYFSFFEIILVSNLIFVLKGWRSMIFFVIFVAFSAYRHLQFFGQWSDDYIPYKNWIIDLF